MRQQKHLASLFAAALLLGGSGAALSGEYRVPAAGGVVDLSPTVSMALKQWWPGGHHMPVVTTYIKHGQSAYSADLIIMDNDTATQIDCPPHMMAHQDSGLPNAGYWGSMTCDKVPIWQLAGEVVKVDGRAILDQSANGTSPIFTIDLVKAAEAKIGRDIGLGDAVLYWSSYNDVRGASDQSPDYLVFDAVRGTAPAWPGPNFDTSDFVGSKGVRLVGLDSPSIGAFGASDYKWDGTQSYRSQTFKAIESHLGVFKHGAVDIEGLVNLHKVPNGSLFIGLPVKLHNVPTAQTRAVAITDRALAASLVAAVKAQKVVDLSVLNAQHLPVDWAGAGVGTYAFPFLQIPAVINYDSPGAQYWVASQIMDSRTGTHISPPAHYGLPPGFSVADYTGEVAKWARAFERAYGKIKNTDVTSDKVPVSQMVGPARVINVQALLGTTDSSSWPASPAITVAHVKAYEAAHGAIRAGEVVIFQTSHTDTHFGEQRRGRMETVMSAPLNGQTEGWPAPTPKVVLYLASKGVRHLAIDAPSMGSVNAREAAMTYWAAANKGMIFTEFLTGVGALPAKGAFYVFLNPKIEDNHGGPGRAIAILPHGR